MAFGHVAGTGWQATSLQKCIFTASCRGGEGSCVLGLGVTVLAASWFSPALYVYVNVRPPLMATVRGCVRSVEPAYVLWVIALPTVEEISRLSPS